MMRKILTSWGIIVLMLALIVGTAAAQSGDDPEGTPTPEPTSQPAAPALYSHPIIQVLGAYFGRLDRTPLATPTVDPAYPPPDPSDDTPSEIPTPEPMMGPEEVAQQIATYHEEGMGFGVLVKLYAMAEAQVEAYNECVEEQDTSETADPDQQTCDVIPVDQLVSEFQSGAGMGQLFKEYGKPALLGVGHVKKELKKQQAELEATPTPEPGIGTTDLQTQGEKPNNGNGNGNGHKFPKGKLDKAQGPKK